VRPDIRIADLRGNVGTRLGKLDAGEFDAIILAAAGLIRLELGKRIAQFLPTDLSLPAGGQGAVGIECRVGDQRIIDLLESLHHQDTADRVIAERALNKRLNGGCQVPIACFAELHADELHLRGLVGSSDGKQLLRTEIRGHRRDAEQLGIRAAEHLLEQGADKILAALYAQQ
jgi:hydroxymethylbilane synthase